MSTESATWDEDVARLRAGEKARLVHDQAGRVAGHPGPIECVWPEKRPRYLIRVWLIEEEDRFDCASFEITSTSTGTSIGSEVMRRLPVGTLIAEAKRRLLDARITEAESEVADPARVLQVEVGPRGEALAFGPDDEFRRRREAYWNRRAIELRRLRGAASGKGQGRRYPPGHLEAVAEVVREARARLDPIAAAVATVFGTTRSAAANQISRARLLGLLDEVGNDDGDS